MYWHRLTLTGPATDVAALSEHLHALGAALTLDGVVIWRHRDGPAALGALSERYPRVAIGSESFEELGDEMICAVSRDGATTVMATRPVLEPGRGYLVEAGGQRLGREHLNRVAAEILEDARPPADHFYCTGAETAFIVAQEVGAFAAATEDYLADGAPDRDALDAVLRLARTALRAATAAVGSRPLAELDFEYAWRVTRCTAWAGDDTLWDSPGNAEWLGWLPSLLRGAAGLVVVAMDSEAQPTRDWQFVESEHGPGPGDALERDGDILLTLCLQTLALFGTVARAD